MGFCPRKLRKAKVLSERIGLEESLVCYITIKLTTNILYRPSVLKGRRTRMFATACRRYRRRTRNACLAEPRAARWGMGERHRTGVASAWSLYSLIYMYKLYYVFCWRNTARLKFFQYKHRNPSSTLKDIDESVNGKETCQAAEYISHWSIQVSWTA